MHTVHVVSVSDDPVADRKYLAFGLLFEAVEGYHNPFFDEIVVGRNPELNLKNYFPDLHTRSYYSYDGSVTTPPCL